MPNNNSNRREIEDQLEAYGISNPREWRESYEYRTQEEIDFKKQTEKNEALEIITEYKRIQEYDEELGFLYDNDLDELKEKIKGCSREVLNEIILELIALNPVEFLNQIYLFEQLPQSFQKELVKLIKKYKNELSTYNVLKVDFNEIIRVFKIIDNKELSDLILEKAGFATIAENSNKLPLIKVSEILKLAKNAQETDWARIANYIEYFPELDPEKIVKSLLEIKDPDWNAVDVLIEKSAYLNLNQDQLLDIFLDFSRDQIFIKRLLLHGNYFDKPHQQLIADKILKRRDNVYLLILQSASVFEKIDINSFLNEILSKADEVAESEIIGRLLHIDSEKWINALPSYIINKIVKKFPEIIARDKFKYFKLRVEPKLLIDSLINNRDISYALIFSRYNNLNLPTNYILDTILKTFSGERAIKLISDALNYFPDYSLDRDLYIQIYKIEYDKVFNNIHKFKNLKKVDIYRLLKDNGTRGFYLYSIEGIISDYQKFEGLELNQEFFEFILLETKASRYLISHLQEFENIDQEKTINILLKYKKYSELITDLEKFTNPNLKYIFETILEEGDVESHLLISHLTLFKKINLLDYADKILETYSEEVITYNLRCFPGIEENKNLCQKIFSKMISKDSWNLEKMREIYEKFKLKDEIFEVTLKLFGIATTKEIYLKLKKLLNGDISQDELNEFKISEKGPKGFAQLKERVEELKNKVIFSNEHLGILSQFELQWLLGYTEFESAEWGDKSYDEFTRIIDYYLSNRDIFRELQLSESYPASEPILINRSHKESQEEYKYSEQFFSRYKTLLNSISAALELCRTEKISLSRIQENISEKVKVQIEFLENKLNSTENENAKKFIQIQIDKLKSLNLRSIKSFQDNFSTLSQFDVFHEDLRQLSFYLAIIRHKDKIEKLEEICSKNTPNFEDIGFIINFIGHITNQETWKQHFTNRLALRSFERIINYGALEEEYFLAQNQETIGTARFDFIPTRGLLFEFSGYIGDACWASKYQSMSESLPNVFSITMIQNKGTIYERVAGSVLMIETLAKDGTPLLVIRGLNPKENIINALNIPDFFNKFISYARELAERNGRRLAIVIDDHSGGSCTNRPNLYTHISSRESSLQKVKLESEWDTTINGYPIVDKTFYI